MSIDTPVDVGRDAGRVSEDTGGGHWRSVEIGGTLADPVESAKMLLEMPVESVKKLVEAGGVGGDRWISVRMRAESVEIGGCR